VTWQVFKNARQTGEHILYIHLAFGLGWKALTCHARHICTAVYVYLFVQV